MAHWFVIGGLILVAAIIDIRSKIKWGQADGATLIVALILAMYLPIVGIGLYAAREETSVFLQQSEYLETHQPENEIEDAALTQKKIELNEWLYKAKYRQDKFEAFSFYPESIQDLEPIQ